MKSTLALFAVIIALSAFAEKQPLSRYQSIMDRHPFGMPPPGAASGSASATAGGANGAVAGMTPEQVTQAQAQLQKSVNFSAMIINTDGSVSVGFSDKTDPKKPASYLLREGESSDGWTVKSVDVYDESLVLEKDGIEISLHLGGTSSPDAGKGKAGSRAPAAPARSGLLRAPGAAADGNGAMSHATRRQLREERDRAAAAAAEKARAEQEEERRQQAAEAEAKAEADKAAREEERAATRQQLQAIQEELRKAREEKQAREREKAEERDDENDQP